MCGCVWGWECTCVDVFGLGEANRVMWGREAGVTGAQRWLVGMQVRRARLSLLIPLFPFYESCLSQRVCAPWDFSSSDWEILQAVITESRCIGGLFALDETGFMFQKMSACWCIKLSVEWLGGGFLFFSPLQFKANKRGEQVITQHTARCEWERVRD